MGCCLYCSEFFVADVTFEMHFSQVCEHVFRLFPVLGGVVAKACHDIKSGCDQDTQNQHGGASLHGRIRKHICHNRHLSRVFTVRAFEPSVTQLTPNDRGVQLGRSSNFVSITTEFSVSRPGRFVSRLDQAVLRHTWPDHIFGSVTWLARSRGWLGHIVGSVCDPRTLPLNFQPSGSVRFREPF